MTIEESARYNELMCDLEYYDQALDCAKCEYDLNPTFENQGKVSQLQNKVNSLIRALNP